METRGSVHTNNTVVARNTRKNRFERPKRLDPQKAENWEIWLKKKGL